MANPVLNDIISVWVIEDDPDDGELIAEAFEENLLQVSMERFDNALQAVDRLRQCAPAELPRIIVTDVNMPQMNGYEFLHLLNNDPGYTGIIKVVLSTSQPVNEKKYLANEADAFFTKPASYGELVNLITQILKLRK